MPATVPTAKNAKTKKNVTKSQIAKKPTAKGLIFQVWYCQNVGIVVFYFCLWNIFYTNAPSYFSAATSAEKATVRVEKSVDGSETFVIFYGEAQYLSNFHACEFTEGTNKFVNNEQYFQYKKAGWSNLSLNFLMKTLITFNSIKYRFWVLYTSS